MPKKQTKLELLVTQIRSAQNDDQWECIFQSLNFRLAGRFPIDRGSYSLGRPRLVKDLRVLAFRGDLKVIKVDFVNGIKSTTPCLHRVAKDIYKRWGHCIYVTSQPCGRHTISATATFGPFNRGLEIRYAASNQSADLYSAATALTDLKTHAPLVFDDAYNKFYQTLNCSDRSEIRYAHTRRTFDRASQMPTALLVKSLSTPRISSRQVSADSGRQKMSREELFELGTPWAFEMAAKFSNSKLDLDDLLQAALLGLQKASEKFKPQKGASFQQLASTWIRQSIFRDIQTTSNLIYIPSHQHGKLMKFLRTYRTNPSSIDFTCPEVISLIQLKRLNETISFGKDLGESLADKAINPLTEVAEEDAKVFLRELTKTMLKTLKYREREVIKFRFGIGDGYTYTLEEVGRILKLTRERVRQIEKKALTKLRRIGQLDKISLAVNESLS